MSGLDPRDGREWVAGHRSRTGSTPHEAVRAWRAALGAAGLSHDDCWYDMGDEGPIVGDEVMTDAPTMCAGYVLACECELHRAERLAMGRITFGDAKRLHEAWLSRPTRKADEKAVRAWVEELLGPLKQALADLAAGLVDDEERGALG